MTYGCHNRPLLPPAADVFSPRCNYDRRKRDAGCAGCRFRARENEQDGVSCDTEKRGTTNEGNMENQHEKIKGYRDLTQNEIDLMNEGKALAEQCGAYIAKLREDATLDQRWVSIGATELQQGFMAVIRGIAQPTTF